MSKKKINRYKLVHEVAKLAREKEKEDRDILENKKSNYIKTVNEVRKKRNYVLEAYDELNTKKDDEQC